MAETQQDLKRTSEAIVELLNRTAAGNQDARLALDIITNMQLAQIQGLQLEREIRRLKEINKKPIISAVVGGLF